MYLTHISSEGKNSVMKIIQFLNHDYLDDRQSLIPRLTQEVILAYSSLLKITFPSKHTPLCQPKTSVGLFHQFRPFYLFLSLFPSFFPTPPPPSSLCLSPCFFVFFLFSFYFPLPLFSTFLPFYLQ